jgi:lipoprotein-anchoring transpeptidase ErfK/SrfK
LRGRNRAALLLLIAFALATAVGVAWSQRGSDGTSDALSDAANLPPPPRPAFRPPPATPLAERSTSVWAPVRRPTLARAAPSFISQPIAPVGTQTSEGTTNLVLVTARGRVEGRSWVKVRLPVLPNNTTGWVPRATLGGYHFVDTHLVVDLDRLTASLYKDGRVVFRTPVGVGTSSAPTPAGEFYVRDKLTRYSSPFYGPVAFGTSARSPTLTDWPEGGFVGIHGTNEPELLPGHVSHGCIRMNNAAILRLARLLPIGTPLSIRGS